MRAKIIKRFAAGTIGVCFDYALIRQPFAVMNNPNELMQTVVQSEPVTEAVTMPPATVPETQPIPSRQSKKSHEANTQPAEVVTEPPQEEVLKDNGYQEEAPEEELQPQQNESGGDVPSLTAFLSNLICGGCRHNCSLVSPRCMKGRAKAESATVEYYETYGA